MSFQYVDRIVEYEPFKRIRGVKNVTRQENFFYLHPDGRRILSPAVLTEALAQLGGWAKIAGSDFKKRPVLIGDEFTEYPAHAEAGDQIDLSVEFVRVDDEVIVTRGVATCNGRILVRSENCRGYLLPMDEFADPISMERQFRVLFKPELAKSSPISVDGIRLDKFTKTARYEPLKFVDGIQHHQQGKSAIAYKNFTSSESYFTDHFPRRPVVPGVIMLTLIGETTQLLLRNDPLHGNPRQALIPKFVKDVRIRKFVEPGDHVVCKVEVINGDSRIHGSEVVVNASLHANDNRVLMAKMGLEVWLN